MIPIARFRRNDSRLLFSKHRLKEVTSLFVVLLVGCASLTGLLGGTLAAKDKSDPPVQAGKATNININQLLRDLQFGNTVKKSDAIAEVARRLEKTPEYMIPDKQLLRDKEELLARKDEIIKLLLSSMRNMSGGKIAEDAAAALACFGPSVTDLLLAEAKGARGSCSAGRALAIRALGKIGTEAKDSASSFLITILKSPNRKALYSAQMINEASVALASMGGPYDPALMPDIILGMKQIEDVSIQFWIALQILDTSKDVAVYARELELVFLKALLRPLVDADGRIEPKIYAALVKLNTPSATRMLCHVVISTKQFTSYQDRCNAAKALATCSNPFDQHIINTYITVLKKEPSSTVIGVVLRNISSWQEAEKIFMPVLAECLKELPNRTLDGGAVEKVKLQKTIEKMMISLHAAAQEKNGNKALASDKNSSPSRAL